MRPYRGDNTFNNINVFGDISDCVLSLILIYVQSPTAIYSQVSPLEIKERQLSVQCTFRSTLAWSLSLHSLSFIEGYFSG